jgi:hypothetical protein
MIKTLKLRSHWVRKMAGLQFLQTIKKFNKIMTVILMINKDGLHPLITIKKWQKLTLLMLRKKLNYQNQHKIKYSKVNKICNKLSNKKNSEISLISADFAIQNVSAHMGIKLLSLDGRTISSIRRFVWECYLCWKHYNVV